jgi:hypothetical protein
LRSDGSPIAFTQDTGEVTQLADRNHYVDALAMSARASALIEWAASLV